MTTVADGLYQYGGMPVGSPMGFGIGNVYYVCQTASTAMYEHMRKKFGGKKYKGDNSAILHTDIASALACCVSERDDYVLVCSDSSDYDLDGTALSMAARNSHLICPGGLGHAGIGAPNACRLDAELISIATVSIAADVCEVAGFFIRGFLNQYWLIYLSGTRWHCNIHDNFIAMSASSAGGGLNYGIYGASANHCTVNNNYITNYAAASLSGAANVIAGGIALGGTRSVIADNIVETGHNTTMAFGIGGSVQTAILRNTLHATSVNGANDAGVLTKGIDTASNSFCLHNNVFTSGANKAGAFTGGTADEAFIENYYSSDGGIKNNE